MFICVLERSNILIPFLYPLLFILISILETSRKRQRDDDVDNSRAAKVQKSVVKEPIRRHRRFLTIREALKVNQFYKATEVEQLNTAYGVKTIITFKSSVSPAEVSIWAPEALKKKILTKKEMDPIKIAEFKKCNIRYTGFDILPSYIHYKFEYYQC